MARKEFPRLFNIRDQVKDIDSLNPVFKELDERLQDPVRKFAWFPREKALQEIDQPQWEIFREDVSELLGIWDEKHARFQQKLIDKINEAFGYAYLKTLGCSDIKFIPRSIFKGEQSPDLRGILDRIEIICEVKTINISQEEAFCRVCHSNRTDEPLQELKSGFFNKLESTFLKALCQIEAFRKGREARRIVFVILNFDDFWAELKEEYFQQIDDYLGKNKIPQLEIVFLNERAGDKHITMQCAKVVNV